MAQKIFQLVERLVEMFDHQPSKWIAGNAAEPLPLRLFDHQQTKVRVTDLKDVANGTSRHCVRRSNSVAVRAKRTFSVPR